MVSRADGIQRLGKTPAIKPGNDWDAGPGANAGGGCSCSSGAAVCPSAAAIARFTTSCTVDWLRKRTSALVGWTFTSTSSGRISTNRWTSGLRSFTVATL